MPPKNPPGGATTPSGEEIQRQLLESAGGTAELSESAEVADLKRSLEKLAQRRKVKIDGDGAAALTKAQREIATLEAYVDELEGSLKRAVHEVEKAEVQRIKSNIRIKNMQFRHHEELSRKNEEMAVRLRDSETSKQTMLAEAKAVIRSLSGKLTGYKQELRDEQMEQRSVRRELLETQQILAQEMVSSGMDLIPPRSPVRPKLQVSAHGGSLVRAGTLSLSSNGGDTRMLAAHENGIIGADVLGHNAPGQQQAAATPQYDPSAADRGMQASRTADELLNELGLNDPAGQNASGQSGGGTTGATGGQPPQSDAGHFASYMGDYSKVPDIYITTAGNEGPKSYPAHKDIMIDNSSRLRVLIQNTTTVMDGKPCVALEDIDTQAFELLLKFCYTEKCDFKNSTDCAAVMQLADRLKMPALRSVCVNYMTSHLGV